MITYKLIQIRLVKAIEKSGLTIADIAKQLDIKESLLTNCLFKNSKLKLDVFANLCRTLNLDAKDIFGLYD